jgi:hypothetical protein
VNLHETVGKRHHANKQNIQSDRNTTQKHIHLIQTSILLETVGNKALLDDVDEIKVENGIHDGKDDLFATIPDFVEVDVLFANLKSSRDPDAENADVDGEQDKEADPFEFCTVGSNDHQ